MNPRVRFRRIVIPAMIPQAISGMANLWLEVTKGSSLIAVVGYTELTGDTPSGRKYQALPALLLLCRTHLPCDYTGLWPGVQTGGKYYRRGIPKLG
jgi:ABC-type amino acid transport system permease subunit